MPDDERRRARETGDNAHASRLGRDLNHARGSAGYAHQELVAGMGAAFTCTTLGIVPTVRHATHDAALRGRGLRLSP